MSATIFTFITHNQNYHHVCVWGFWRRRVACGDYSTNCCSTVTNEHGEKLHHRAMATYSKGVYIPISKYIEGTTYSAAQEGAKKGSAHFHTFTSGGRHTAQAVNELNRQQMLKQCHFLYSSMDDGGVSVLWREGYQQINQKLFLYRLMKIIVECCRMIS